MGSLRGNLTPGNWPVSLKAKSMGVLGPGARGVLSCPGLCAAHAELPGAEPQSEQAGRPQSGSHPQGRVRRHGSPAGCALGELSRSGLAAGFSAAPHRTPAAPRALPTMRLILTSHVALGTSTHLFGANAIESTQF